MFAMTTQPYLRTLESTYPRPLESTYPRHLTTSNRQYNTPSPIHLGSIIEQAAATARQTHTYKETTTQEMTSPLLPPSYHYTPLSHDPNIQEKRDLSAKIIGHMIIPSSFLHRNSKVQKLRQQFLDTHFQDTTGWKVKRLTIATAHGTLIDTIILFKSEQLHKQQWLFRMGGSTEIYENRIQKSHWNSWASFADEVGLSGLVYFNPPYIGSSKSNMPFGKSLLLLSIKAVLHFLKDPHGIGAKHIIMYGLSMGGGIITSFFEEQSRHCIDPLHHIAAVVNDKSYTQLSSAASSRTGMDFLSKLIKSYNWDLGSPDVFMRLNTQKLVISAAEDAVIPDQESLRARLNDDNQTSFVQHSGGHTTSFLDDSKARDAIVQFFQSAFHLSSEKQRVPRKTPLSPITRTGRSSPDSTTPKSPKSTLQQRFPSLSIRRSSLEINSAEPMPVYSENCPGSPSLGSSSSLYFDCRTP